MQKNNNNKKQSGSRGSKTKILFRLPSGGVDVVVVFDVFDVNVDNLLLFLHFVLNENSADAVESFEEMSTLTFCPTHPLCVE